MAVPLNPNRKPALWLLRRGYLSVAEIGQAFGETRQTVRFWAQGSGIDYKHARKSFVERCRSRAMKATNHRES